MDRGRDAPGRGGWRADGTALVAVALVGLAMWAMLALVIAPPARGAACLAGAPPWWCRPRGLVIALQGVDGWGIAATCLGLAGFAGAGGLPVQAASVGLGLAAVLDYNVTAGMLGLALGAWGWMRRDGWSRGRDG